MTKYNPDLEVNPHLDRVPSQYQKMRKFREYLAKSIKKIKGVETQAEFARRLGIGQASLNRILNKEQGISLDMLELICHRLKIDLKDLMKP